MAKRCIALLLGMAFCVAIPAYAKAVKPTAAPEREASFGADVVTVSNFEYNTFVFSTPIKRLFFPAGSPVVGTPVYLSDNTQVMLQFASGHAKPVQMVVELDNSQVITQRVFPKAVPGVVYAVNGAKARVAGGARAAGAPKPTASTAPTATPHGEDLEILKSVVANNEAPAGFQPTALPKPTRFDKFSVVPLAGWTNGANKQVFVFSLVAVPGQTAVVAAPQFYRPGITAVMLDGDVVDESNTPQLFVVEETNDE
jgi:hypothetical protein